jgi:hypothetical protein
MRPALLIIIAATVLTAGCGSLGSTGSTAAAGPSASAGTPSSSAAAAPSSAPCTTRACIVVYAESLKGSVAKDNAVMTKITCKKSTVKQVVSGTYTVHCTGTYSDGMVARGIASVLLAGNGQVEWEPTDIISEGSN